MIRMKIYRVDKDHLKKMITGTVLLIDSANEGTTLSSELQ